MSHRIIVGLGNPGSQYQFTRHNIGFLALDRLAEEWKISFSDQPKLKSKIAKIRVDGTFVWLVKPQTFMNRSGQAVESLISESAIDSSEDMLVVVDDWNLDFGRMRIKPEGSAGGHNGLKSIQDHLRTQKYPRLRMGIGRPAPEQNPSDYVLGEFLATERDGLTSFLGDACEACRIWVREDLTRVMERFNRKEKKQDGEE